MISAIQQEIKSKNDTNYFSNIVRWFGKNSYELYLFHIIVLALMKEIYDVKSLGDYGKLVWFVVFLAVSALVSGGIAKFYSQSMNKWLREFFLSFRRRAILVPQ